MKILVLSPHLDDAVLSVGAAIAARVAAGDHVVVATVFSEVTDARRAAEDTIALAALGARALHVDARDAPLRGHALTWTSLCGAPPTRGLVDDTAVAARAVIGVERPDELWAPLACGGHVDHRAVALAALSYTAHLPIALYEDRPYARAAGAVARAWTQLGGETIDDSGNDHGEDDVDARVHFLVSVGAPSLGDAPAPSLVHLRGRRWRRHGYVVGDARALRQRAIDAYATERASLVGPQAGGGWPWDDRCERLWRPA